MPDAGGPELELGPDGLSPMVPGDWCLEPEAWCPGAWGGLGTCWLALASGAWSLLHTPNAWSVVPGVTSVHQHQHDAIVPFRLS